MLAAKGRTADGCGGSPPRYIIMSVNSGNAFLLSSSFSVRFLRKYVLPILSLQVLACVRWLSWMPRHLDYM